VLKKCAFLLAAWPAARTGGDRCREAAEPAS